METTLRAFSKHRTFESWMTKGPVKRERGVSMTTDAARIPAAHLSGNLRHCCRRGVFRDVAAEGCGLENGGLGHLPANCILYLQTPLFSQNKLPLLNVPHPWDHERAEPLRPPSITQ